ncbi:Anti-sigma factor N-terminus [Bacillus sp. OV322]|uniref:anti-sigma factor domain-containing protein n=1 Tax=Bacillus sp. OV322 TaxID=1882764 RepID=UPI0008E6E9E6|nr:anti-sigma factor domain-containing protein [Bacillus sp. OV322]SFC02230.1 Anti-sigma factor N-terminus [Bacillus sp. OV322]
MKKGIILSIDQRFITLLTPDGEFLRIFRDKRAYEVGEEMIFTPVKRHNKHFPIPFSFIKTPSFAIIAILLITCIFFPVNVGNSVSAYMTFDVNPSIELALDDHLHVINLNGLNSDGKKVISKLPDWKDADVKVITSQIIRTTNRLGYFSDNKQIVVSTTILNRNKELDKRLDKDLEEVSKDTEVPDTKMKVIAATEKDRKKAKKQGISTGRFIEGEKEKTESKRIMKQDEPIKRRNTSGTTSKQHTVHKQVQKPIKKLKNKSSVKAVYPKISNRKTHTAFSQKAGIKHRKKYHTAPRLKKHAAVLKRTTITAAYKKKNHSHPFKPRKHDQHKHERTHSYHNLHSNKEWERSRGHQWKHSNKRGEMPINKRNKAKDPA